MLPELVSLGQHHDYYGVNQQKRIIPGCSQMLGDHFRTSFVTCGGKMKH